ncbi:MAG: putative transport system permease protein [Actinomycetota bacterium]|nr:putative transport system permease protein [Actinomycetota bacterium]
MSFAARPVYVDRVTGIGARAAMWARADVRARLRSLLALGVLVGLTVGLAVAALAGARRTDTAFARLRNRTQAADAIVFPGQVGVFKADWSALARRPEVAMIARWTLTFGRAKGFDEEATFFLPSDHVWLREVDRPVVVEGRMFDATKADEVVVGPEAAKNGLPLGSTIDYRPYGATQDDTTGVAPNGPAVQLHVVGVVRQIDEYLFVPGMVMVSPAFLDGPGVGTLLVENAMVRLTHGARDVPQLQRDVSTRVAPGTPVDNLHSIQRRVDTTLDVERTALTLLAVAVAVAGLMLVAQALRRSVSVLDDDIPALRAMGFDRPTFALAPVCSHLVVATVGVALTVVTALVASRSFPIGLAAEVDPDRGVHADWTVLGAGIAVATIGVLGFAAIVGWRLAGTRSPVRTERTSGLGARVREAAPLTVGLGVTMAFPRGRDRKSAPVRPALVGAMVGVLGVVAATTIDHGLRDALTHPERAGVTWDAAITPKPADRVGADVARSRINAIAAVPDVSGVAVVGRQVSEAAGTAGVQIFAVTPKVGSVELETTKGDAPGADDEAAIGPQTAHVLGVKIGDTITVGSLAHRVHIVGEALFPSDVHASFDEGIWLTPKTFGTIDPATRAAELNRTVVVAVRFVDGADKTAAFARLTRAEGDAVATTAPPDVPLELTNLRNVRILPRLLMGFLALLAAAAVAHVLATSVRRRRRDFAMLRALGMTRRSTRSIINLQGSAIAIAGLVVGIPAGVIVGQSGWHLIADRVPLRFVHPVALLAIFVVVPAALAVVNLLALAPGRRASHLNPAEVLHTE